MMIRLDLKRMDNIRSIVREYKIFAAFMMLTAHCK